MAHGARVEIREDPLGYEPFNRNLEMGTFFAENLQTLGGELDDIDVESMSAGSSDIGNVSWKVPALEARLRLTPPEVAPHTPEFAVASGGEPGSKLLRLGAQAMAMTAIDLMSSPERMSAVRRCFDETS